LPSIEFGKIGRPALGYKFVMRMCFAPNLIRVKILQMND
jgi:hypothetical protein